MPNFFAAVGTAADGTLPLPVRSFLRSLHRQVTPLRRIVDGHRLRQAHRARDTARYLRFAEVFDGL